MEPTRKRHEPVSEDGEHYVCNRCGVHLSDDDPEGAEMPLCARRSVAWRSDAASIDVYLQDEEAAHDVARLLAEPDPKFKGTTDGDALFYLERGEAGAWRTVEIDPVRAGGGGTVYYRAEGDGYVVSDLGGAVRRLRLRTGWADPYIGDPMLRRLRACVPEEWDVDVGPDGQVYAISDKASRGVPAADLPRAIVAVMLAARRVASLDI